MSHTQGPWEIVRANGGRAISIKSGHASVARISTTNINARANADLIVSAPDLLEACQSAMRGEPGWAERIHAAVARATGEESTHG